MKLPKTKSENPKSFLVQILQWLYLIIAVLAIIFALASTNFNFITKLGFPKELFLGIGLAFAVYSLILSGSFFTQKTNLLILSLVLIFFTTIGALIMFGVSVPNSQALLTGHLPPCIKDLTLCSLKDGIIVSSAALISISVPALILNIITIVGTVKAIASGD